ncbi:putative signal transducing protein [Microbulbifer sp. ARAS458-1]|uniref:putative signal transducing protein n=1 Tax=Microbulbifer sp. ARAS458-1 TaxID=3140242 RepID=UPI0038783F4F
MASKIYTTDDQLLSSYLRNLLQSAGYPVLTQQTRVEPAIEGGDGVGKEVSGQGNLDWQSELWLIHDADLASAQQVLQQALSRESA